VREAVESTFKVTVTRVNIQNIKGKPKRSRRGLPTKGSDSKRAIVTLKQGDKIELV
jgi:large subunit ribosomal protein L23